MKIEGVTFVDSAVVGMDEETFVEAFVDKFWLDRSEADRRKMLEDAYVLVRRGLGQ